MKPEETKALAEAIVDALVARLSAPPSAPTPAAVEPEYMKVSAFARATGYSRSTIQSYIKRGMPHVSAGAGARIKVQAAREWLALGGARVQKADDAH